MSRIRIYKCFGGRTTAPTVAEYFGVTQEAVHAALHRYNGDMEKVVEYYRAKIAKQGRTLKQIRAERIAAERKQCDEIAERLWGKKARA